MGIFKKGTLEKTWEHPDVDSIQWSDDTTQLAKSLVDTYPELMAIDSGRMARLAPEWSSMNQTARRDWWAKLCWAIALPESGRRRHLIYLESTMSQPDSVTGLAIRSEGLLQLSYQDVENYRYDRGDVIWTLDSADAIRDYAAKSKYGTLSRTILRSKPNLNLGLFIMRKQLFTFKPNELAEVALGHYWYTINPRHSEPFKQILEELKK